MSLLKKIARILVSLLFAVSLSLLSLTIVLSLLTSYDNSKAIFTSVYAKAIGNQVTPEQIEETYNSLSLYCKERDVVSVPFMNENITINCSEIATTNSTNLIYLVSEKLFDIFYYKSYGCEFIKCLQEINSAEGAMILFSSTAHAFFNNLILIVLLVTALIGAILLLLIETWPERFKSFGLHFLFIGVFFFLMPYLKELVLEKLPPELAVIGDVLDPVFKIISSVLLIFLIVGVILAGIWLLMRFFVKKKQPK